MNQQTIDDFFRVLIGIGTAISAYQSWRASRNTRVTRKAMRSLVGIQSYDGACLNAVHCECCPEYAK